MNLSDYNRMTAELDASLSGRPTKAVFDPANLKTELPNGVILVNGSDLHPKPIRWLWNGYLALGKFGILAGAPGQGKTTLAVAMMATVTSGGRWPDGTRCAVGSALFWTAEDDPEDTLLPRLLAAGADPSRCYFVMGTRIDGEVQSFDPARDMAELEDMAHKIGNVKLIVVDPVVTAVTGDSHKNVEVRRGLQPLVDLASNLDAVVLGISHLSKGGAGGDPTSRVIGSVAFAAVARFVLMAAKVKSEPGSEHEDRRVFVRSKSNIGPDGGGFEYHIEQAEPLPGIHASLIAWGKAIEGTASELMTDPNEDGDDTASETTDAVSSLLRILSRDTVPSKEAVAAMKANGHSEKITRKARESIGVIVKRTGFGKEMSSYWKLPESAVVPVDATPAHSSPLHNVGISGHECQTGARMDGLDDPEATEDFQDLSVLSAESSGLMESSTAPEIGTQLPQKAEVL